MALKEVLSELMASLQDGKVSRGRDTVADCLVHVAFRLLDEYTKTDSPLSRDLAALATAFGNRKDPMLRDLNFAEHMAANGFVKVLKLTREKNLEQAGKVVS